MIADTGVINLPEATFCPSAIWQVGYISPSNGEFRTLMLGLRPLKVLVVVGVSNANCPPVSL